MCVCIFYVCVCVCTSWSLHLLQRQTRCTAARRRAHERGARGNVVRQAVGCGGSATRASVVDTGRGTQALGLGGPSHETSRPSALLLLQLLILSMQLLLPLFGRRWVGRMRQLSQGPREEVPVDHEDPRSPCVRKPFQLCSSGPTLKVHPCSKEGGAIRSAGMCRRGSSTEAAASSGCAAPDRVCRCLASPCACGRRTGLLDPAPAAGAIGTCSR